MLFVCYPKCTTCQKARTWLDAQGVSYEVRDIKLQTPVPKSCGSGGSEAACR